MARCAPQPLFHAGQNPCSTSHFSLWQDLPRPKRKPCIESTAIGVVVASLLLSQACPASPQLITDLNVRVEWEQKSSQLNVRLLLFWSAWVRGSIRA